MTIRAAGVCHSDLSMVNGTLAARFPLVLGHEATGVVAEVGPGSRLAVGTPVVLNWAPACRACWCCRHGEPWLCADHHRARPLPRGETDDGTPLHLTLGLGALAEAVVVPEQRRDPDPRRAAARSRPRCSAARCSPASARCATPPGSHPASRSR